MSYLEEGCKMGCLMGIIFGAVGFFVAGPVGAIIGLLIGILGAVGGKTSMKSKLLVPLMASAVLAGCATVDPEYRMIPTGDHNVGVRFSRGNAAMVSNGPAGAVMLLPVRYNATSKMFFTLAAFNTSGQPINFGTEDVRILLEDGTPLYIQDYNYLRHQERVKAQRDLNAAWIDAGVEGYLAYLDTKSLPDRTRRQIAFRTASGSYAVDSATIESRLRQAMSAWGRNVPPDHDHRPRRGRSAATSSPINC